VKFFGVATGLLIFFTGLGMAATSVFIVLRSLVTKTQVFVAFNCSAILTLCLTGYLRHRAESVVSFLVPSLIVLAAFNGTLWISANKVKEWKIRA
jgi:hypothetical protein